MTDFESILQQLLTSSKADLGSAVPRLITEKPQVARNGLVHGLTAQNTFLTDNELVRYLDTGAKFFKDMRPVGIRETELTQCIIDAYWRLKSAPAIESRLKHSSIVRHALKLSQAHPEASPETIEAFAEADAFRSDGAHIEVLGRYETRLRRSLEAMNKTFDLLQNRRFNTRGHETFNAEDCEGLNWYTKLTEVATKLVEARKELKKKSQVVEDVPIESTTSEANLVGKNRMEITTPLTRKAAESIAKGHEFGLLTEIERTLFKEERAA